MLVGQLNEKKDKEKALQQELTLHKKKVDEVLVSKRKKMGELAWKEVDETLALEKKKMEDFLGSERKKVKELIVVEKRKVAEALKLEKKRMEELLAKEKQKAEALLLEEKRKLDDALGQLNAIKEKGKAIITPADEELAELKSELERKNLEFAQQFDALKLIAKNNDELSAELETMKEDFDDMDKEL